MKAPVELLFISVVDFSPAVSRLWSWEQRRCMFSALVLFGGQPPSSSQHETFPLVSTRQTAAFIYWQNVIWTVHLLVNSPISLLKLSFSFTFCPHSQRAPTNSRSYANPMTQLVRFEVFVCLFIFLGDDVTKYDFKHLFHFKTSLAAFN